MFQILDLQQTLALQQIQSVLLELVARRDGGEVSFEQKIERLVLRWRYQVTVLSQHL